MSETEAGEALAAAPTGPGGGRTARVAAVVTAALLFVAVAVVLAVTTPWNPLPGDVPGGHVAPDPTRDFTPAEIARSQAFDAALNPPAYAGLLVGLAVVLVLGLTPLGARLIGWTTRTRSRPSSPSGDAPPRPPDRLRLRPLRIVIATLTITTLLRVIALPFGIWRETVRRDYGLSTRTWPSWLADQLKSLTVTWVVYTVALLLLYALIRRFPRYWWTGAAAGGFLLVVLASFIYPVTVEPVFNKFRSLPQGRLRTDILAMAERDGVPVKDVLVADASRRTTSLNAYVSGFGSTRRIVLYDTLLESPPPRVRSIVAHELGHAEHDDVLWGTLVGALGVAGALCLLYPLLTSPRLRHRAGLSPARPTAAGPPGGDPAADPRSIALLLALVAAGSTLAAPVQNFVSRHIEARADAHALNLTRDPSTFISMQRELSVRNISDLNPDTLERVLWMTHPSAPERMAMARTWSRLHPPEP